MIGYICGHLEQFKPHKIRGFSVQNQRGNILLPFPLKMRVSFSTFGNDLTHIYIKYKTELQM